MLRTWVEINRGAVMKNYKVFRRAISPKTKLMAVVKSNAYGNELIGFSKIVDRLGANAFGVDSITEGLALRKEGFTKPILVLGYTMPENFQFASEHDIAVTISSFELLRALKKITRPIKIHIKIDSGMHRQGFFPEDAKKAAKTLSEIPNVQLEGIYTHFANAKNPKFSRDTDKQAEEFLKAAKVFEDAGFSFIKHACASAGTLLFPKYHFDMVRVGIGLHGLWPAKEVAEACSGKIKLTPVLSWKTIIAEKKLVRKDESVGYDFTEKLEKDSWLAVCPVGYWHGFTRMLSSKGEVLVRGKRARVVGRVAMDMIVIDVSGIQGVKPGDEVVLIGSQKKERVSAEEVAEKTGTSNYEVVTRINPKIHRIFV